MYGITFALKDSVLLNSPREWIISRSKFVGDLLSCAYCTGFYSGWISFILLKVSGISDLPWFGLVVYAFVGASVSYVMDVIMLRAEGDD